MKFKNSKTNLRIFSLAIFISLFILSQSSPAFLFWKNSKKKRISKSSERIVPKTESPVSSTLKSLTLIQAYQLALKKSETIAISAEEINQAKARFYRGFDYFLPKVDYVMSRTERDASGDVSVSGGVNSDLRRPVTPENKFTFSQPIFSGFREIAVLKGAGADKKQQLLNWQRAKELLFIDVMNAYYAVLQVQRNVKTLTKASKLSSDRIKDLASRIKIGRSRHTERQSALADLRLVESDLVQAQSLLTISKRLLEFYIDQSLEGVVLMDERVLKENVDSSHFEMKAKMRSDVQAAQQGYFLGKSQVIMARANLFPMVEVDGNYYTKRIGFQADNDWDFTLKMTVPIFELGKTLADIKSANSSRESKRLIWQRAVRLAQLDIENAFQDFQAAQLNRKVLLKAKRASQKNYELVSSDYKVNLVNNLDVLDALRRLEDIELRYNEAFFQMKKSYWKFKVALGDILDGVEK